MRTWELMRLAMEGALRATTRSVLTTCGIAVACGALVCMVSFVLGLQEQFEAPFQQLGLLNNIQVRPHGVLDEDDDESMDAADEDEVEQPTGPSPPLDDEMVKRFEAIPGVDYAYPEFRLSQIRLQRGEHTRTSFAIGLPREASLLNVFDDLLVAGDFFSFAHRPEMLLGQGNLKKLGFDSAEQAIGESIELTAAGLAEGDGDQFQFERTTVKFVIVGVFQPPSAAMQFGADAILLPVDQMRNLPSSSIERNLQRLRAVEGARLTGFSQVMVRTKRPSDVAAVEKAIRKMGYRTTAFATEIDEVRKFFLYMKLLLGAVGTVGLVVAGLGILNTQLMSVMERVQEIGILKAIGATSGDVRVIFLTESAALGVIGGIGGLGLAWFVSSILQYAFDRIAASEGIEGSITAFYFPLWLLVGGVAYATAVSIISGLYPANRAARIDPIRALRQG